MGNAFLWLGLAAGIVITILIGAYGLVILWKMVKGSIDLSKLLSEDSGAASLSRFQFLIFTLVISMSLFLLVLANIDAGTNAFPEISSQALLLLGISGGTYAVSKGIQKNSEVEKAKAAKAPPPPPSPPGI
jgi:hypothetical protein